MLCFRSFPLAKNIMDKRGWGGIKIFLRIFCCLTVPKVSVGESFSLLLI